MYKSNNERRNFLKTLGLGAAAITLPSVNNLNAQPGQGKAFESTRVQVFEGFDFELLFSGEHFVGIGSVKVNDLPIRSGKLPMFAQIATPDAIELVNYKILDKTSNDSELRFVFSVQKKSGDTMEWMLHTVRNRRNMTDWTKGPEDAADTSVTLAIKPAERKLGNLIAKGFSYQYNFKSKNLSIYKITDRSTWEIGGKATGNELWMRNGVVEPIKEFNKISDFYSTEWYLPGISNPNIFQFHPLQTHLQGFTFTSSAMGSLITFPQKVSHIRTLIEKWRGSDAIVHFHEHCGDLANSFETSPVEVYFIPGQLDRAGRSNLYHQVKEMVHDELHAQIGMKRERITSYGVIEEWTEPDFDNYTHHILPKLIQAGAKTVFITNQCQNDMNTWGVSNMCCNVDFKISETVGEDKLKAFCQKARNNGVKVEMWGNTAISTLTERFMHRDGKEKGVKFLPYKGSIMEVVNKSESPFVRNPSNAIEADHYTPRFCALNLRDKDIREYWMKQWKYFHDELGIEGIFLDSSFNMSSDKFHHAQFDKSKNWGGATLDQKDLQRKYRPEIEPPKLIQSQYHAHLEWIVEMQKMGYQYSAEDLGVFGINRTGPSVANRIPSLSIWSDSFCDFNEDEVKNLGYEPLDIFFKGLAYRMMWKINWNFKKQKIDLGIENPVAYKLIKVYNEVTDVMYNREILPEENGVIYRLGETSVLWAFAYFEYKHDNPLKITEMVFGKPVQSGKKETFQAQKLNVYKFEYSA